MSIALPTVTVLAFVCLIAFLSCAKRAIHHIREDRVRGGHAAAYNSQAVPEAAGA